MCVRPILIGVAKVRVPCGQCIECRLKRSREWALRCVHEASLHEENSFVTLTYADEYLPEGGSLDGPVPKSKPGAKPGAFAQFMKRVRKEVGPVRYFHAGEYGEETGRPHYHALLFGLRFADEQVVGESRGGHVVRESAQLQWLWPGGRHQIGGVSFESAAYVARYCVKKFMGPGAAAHYERVDAQGVIHQLEPEYATMSRRPGIGYEWYKKFRGEVYRDDGVLQGAVMLPPPRYYDKKEYEVDQRRMDVVKVKRVERMEERYVSGQELEAREVIALRKRQFFQGAA